MISFAPTNAMYYAVLCKKTKINITRGEKTFCNSIFSIINFERSEDKIMNEN